MSYEDFTQTYCILQTFILTSTIPMTHVIPYANPNPNPVLILILTTNSIPSVHFRAGKCSHQVNWSPQPIIYWRNVPTRIPTPRTHTHVNQNDSYLCEIVIRSWVWTGWHGWPEPWCYLWYTFPYVYVASTVGFTTCVYEKTKID